MKLKLVIDNNVLDEYNKYYFKKHPRARKAPIARPIHPSINVWMILMRPAMNLLKQKWKDFIIWYINDLGYQDLKIDNCIIEYTYFMPTKRRADNDNMTPKFINDGLVESGFLVDDDYKHLTKIILGCDYDKNNPRTEIVVYKDGKISIEE